MVEIVFMHDLFTTIFICKNGINEMDFVLYIYCNPHVQCERICSQFITQYFLYIDAEVVVVQ